MRSRFRVCRFARLKSNGFTLYCAEKNEVSTLRLLRFARCLQHCLAGNSSGSPCHLWSGHQGAPPETNDSNVVKQSKAFLQGNFISKKKRHFLQSFFLHIFLKALCLIDNAPEDGGAEACFAGCTRVSLINVPNESIKLRQGKSMKKHQTM